MNLKTSSERKDLSRFLQVEPSIFLAKFLPFSVYRQYLSLLGFYYFSIRRQERKNMSKSLRFVLGRRYSRLKFRLIIYKTYFGIFKHYSEKMINAYRPLPKMIHYLNDNISISNQDWLNELNETKRGGIIITAHFGAVEYLPLFLSSKNYRPTMIVRFKTDKLKSILTYKSALVDLELLDADNQNVIYKALKAIRNGRILITLCDEVKNWRPCKKEKMCIFGQTVPRDRTLDVLSRRTKAPCCLGLMQRLKNGYKLRIHPLDGKDYNTSLSEAAWNILEQYIYRHPEQWYLWPSFENEYKKYLTFSESYAN
jgi:lauroyl/myristoyl acyltransferase